MARPVPLFEPAIEIEGAGVALQLKLYMRAAGHRLVAAQPRKPAGIHGKAMAAGVVAFSVVTLVTQLHMNFFFAGAEFNEPLPGPGILRMRIRRAGHRITGPQQAE